MGEKGMDTGGPGAQMGAQIAAAPAGDSIAQAMGGVGVEGAPGGDPPAQSSGPDAGEIVGDILDPLGIHKLFG